MAKCRINENNEITNFWDDSHPQIPEDALDCDVVKPCKSHNAIWLYTLVDGVATPTEEGVKWEAQAYSRNRGQEYPPIGDQLDEIYHKGITEWKKTIKAVKDKHPKP